MDLRTIIRNVANFPRPGVMFRDISPLLQGHFDLTVRALDALFSDDEWARVDALAGIESRGFILGAALAAHRGKGFVLVRKQGKLPPPVVDISYALEYGSGILEMQHGAGSVVVIDDVLATGGTMAASAELCVRAGYEVRGLATLVDLKIVPDFRWRDIPLRASVAYDS